MTPTPHPIVNISAHNLYAERESNSERYDRTYKGQTVLVSGTICAIESDRIDLYSDATSEFVGICFPSVSLGGLPEQVLVIPSVGDSFAAICTVGGFILGTIFMDDCIVPDAAVLEEYTIITPSPLPASTATSIPTTQGVTPPIQTPTSTPVPGYGPGILAVGQDIEPGIYAGKVGLGVFDSCYWARLRGVSGDFSDIIANDNAIGQFYISVADSDEYLEVGCRITPIADWPEPEEPPQSIEPGIHLVGRDITPGTYQGQVGTGVLDSCYWARLSGLSGEFNDIIANDNANGSFYVSVSPTDLAFTNQCALEAVRE